METSTALDPSEAAVADLPPTSGAHWAGRDNEVLYRRPPAVHSLADEPDTEPDTGPDAAPAGYRDLQAEAWDAFGPPAAPAGPEAAWNAFGESPAESEPMSGPWGRPETAEQPAVAVAAPVPTRASFGVSDGPISPSGLLDDRLPAIGELGTGHHEIRPHRATRRQPAGDHGRGAGEPPRRSRMVVAGIVMLAVVVLLGGAVAGVAFFSGPDSPITSTLTLGAGRSEPRAAEAPLAGRTTAALDVVAATAKVSVRTADLGDDLYRITGGGSGPVPAPVVTKNLVRLYLTPGAGTAAGTVDVTLTNRVRWALTFGGGSQEQNIDLTGVRITGIDLAGGSRRTTLTLPAATGTVPIRVTGAVENLRITAPAASPVRIRVGSGAQTVKAGARTLRDVAPGSTLTPRNWGVPDRYDVDAAARVTLLSVEKA